MSEGGCGHLESESSAKKPGPGAHNTVARDRGSERVADANRVGWLEVLGVATAEGQIAARCGLGNEQTGQIRESLFC